MQERKSQGSRHKHSVGASRSLDSLLDQGRFFVRAAEVIAVPAGFSAELGLAVVSLSELGQSELLGVCVDPSGCALLSLLLRVTANPEVSAERALAADRLVESVLLGREVPDAVFGLAGERSGSHFLEAAIECCGFGLFARAVREGVLGRVSEYVQDGAGNFAVQSVLKRLAAELLREPASTEAAHLADRMLAELVDPATVESKVAELLRSRAGVLVWALACEKHALNKGILAEAVVSEWCAGYADLTAALSRQLLVSESSQGEESRSGPSLRGPTIVARIVNQLLLGEAGPRVVHALSLFPREGLLQLATSGQLSRLLLDPVLDRQTTVAPAAKDTDRLVHAIVGLSADLAAHFTGQHVLRKAFDFASVDVKELIATNLAAASDRLSKSKEGRNTMAHVKVEDYRRSPKDWRAQVVRAARAAELLQALDTNDGDGGLNLEDGVDGADGKRRKRKRRHKATVE